MVSFSLVALWFPYSHISLWSFAVNSSPTPPVASVGPNAISATDVSAKVIDGKVARTNQR